MLVATNDSETGMASTMPDMMTTPANNSFHDPLDDVFGDSSGIGDGEAAAAHLGQHTSPQQPNVQSEIPRLRRTHTTNGYREGVAESKSRYVQEGFDEGYPLGAMLGFKSAWLTEALQSMARNVRSDSELASAATEIKSELALQSILSREYFDEDGIWSYPVSAPEDEQDFDVISRAHPLILKWTEIVQRLADSVGLELEPFTTKYEDGS